MIQVSEILSVIIYDKMGMNTFKPFDGINMKRKKHNTLHTTDIMIISHVSLFDIMSTLDKDGLYHLHVLSPEYPPLKLL